jgi:hypothetical protein
VWARERSDSFSEETGQGRLNARGNLGEKEKREVSGTWPKRYRTLPRLQYGVQYLARRSETYELPVLQLLQHFFHQGGKVIYLILAGVPGRCGSGRFREIRR